MNKSVIGFLSFQSVESHIDPLFDEAMAIYLHSFPSNERQSLASIASRLAEKKATLHVGIIDKKVVSMALMWRFNDNQFVLLDYLAVKEELRNIKVGSQMFQYLAEVATKERCYIIIEVENHLFGDHKGQKQKRINFYMRNGCFLLLNVPYKLPALDGTVPTEMFLMIYPRYVNEDIMGLKLKSLVADLYINLYKVNPNNRDWYSIIDRIPLSILQDNTEII